MTRPSLSAPLDLQAGPARAEQRERWARQPRLGVLGLVLVLPVALLLAVAAGGPEPSLLVLAPLVTFGLPVVAVVAFWWDDWPGSTLRASWSASTSTRSRQTCQISEADPLRDGSRLPTQ